MNSTFCCPDLIPRQTPPRFVLCWFAIVMLALGRAGKVEEASGQVSYQNPVIPGDHPDPSVIRVGADFWATSTSSEWGPQFPLLHSKDLVNWELAGVVFPHRPEWAVGNFWAPEISEHKGRYSIYYVEIGRASCRERV